MTTSNHSTPDAQQAPRSEVDAFYEIQIKGHLDPSWSDWLGELTITPQADDVTLLTGPIVDQAALHGILDRLYALNLTILSVVHVKNEDNAGR
ncbi:MAG TPA: hypothetical protein VMP08_03940 [Anaerolineae bacterium]|nr:hypothetical protein [Anaerolineae bacterium]